MTPVHYLPVGALVPHGTGALASLPPQAERSLVLVVGVGAAQRAEGAIASQKSELNFNYSSIHSDVSKPLTHASFFPGKVGGWRRNPGKVAEQVHLFFSACSEMFSNVIFHEKVVFD